MYKKILVFIAAVSMLVLSFSVPVSAKEIAESPAIGKTFAEQFPDPNLAKGIAASLEKTVDDVITYQDVQSTSVIRLPYSNISSLSGVEDFYRLNKFYLSGNNFTEYPKEFNQLEMNKANSSTYYPELNVLWLDHNEITTLDGLGDVPFPALTQLYLDSNKITELPENFANYKMDSRSWTGTEIYLADNQLTEIPADIFNMYKLRRLTLDNNNITQLPDTIGNAVNSTEDLLLSLSNNQLVELPESIGELANLAYLDVGGNQLTSLPASFGNLTNLTTLSLRNNLLPLNYDTVINPLLPKVEVGYEVQDKLGLFDANQEFTIQNRADVPIISPNETVKLNSTRELAPEHSFIFDEFIDENGNALVNVDEFFDSTGAVIKDGTVYAKVRAEGSGMFPNSSENALTDEVITLNFIASALKNNGTVDVLYQDEAGSEIAEPVILTGPIGTEYQSETKEIPGYQLLSTVGNSSGVYAETSQTVIYVYQKTNDSQGELPETGSSGVLYILSGIGVLGIGGMLVSLARKNR